MSEEQKPLVHDILGLAPTSRAVEKVTDTMSDGIASFLGRICMPAAKESGLFMKDIVHQWRTRHIYSMTEKTKRLMTANAIPDNAHAHPRIVHEIVECSSWVEDTEVQDMWSGLLASSCTESGDDESNLIFADLLAKLTRLQAKVVKYSCENSDLYVTKMKMVLSKELFVSYEELKVICEESDLHRIDRELDCMHSFNLIGNPLSGGMHPHLEKAKIHPSSLALHMYVRCQGSRLAPSEFFKDRILASTPLNASEPATPP